MCALCVVGLWKRDSTADACFDYRLPSCTEDFVFAVIEICTSEMVVRRVEVKVASTTLRLVPNVWVMQRFVLRVILCHVESDYLPYKIAP